MSAIHVGCCGWCLPQATYFRTFNLIEIQQTFYHPPRLATVQRWRESAPAEFEFTLKAFQAITHSRFSPTFRKCKLPERDRLGAGSFRDTPVVRQAWQTTAELARALRATWVIFQCPPTFGPTAKNLANLRRFFRWADRGGLRFGWEPRGPGWERPLVAELCRELDVVHVVDPFVESSAFGEPRYFRLHGKDGYDYRYTDAELSQLAEWCAEKPTYCMFNNVPMADDAQRFVRLFTARRAPARSA